MKVVNPWLAQITRKQAHRRSRIAEVERRVGLSQPADADTVHAPASVIGLLNGRPKGTERSRRRRHVLALQTGR